MIEQLNHTLFLLINATPASAQWHITLAIFIARRVIFVIPALIVLSWLWGCQQQIQAIRQLLLKAALAMIVAMILSFLSGVLFPQARPFALGIGYQFLPHAADNSFPSDHGTVMFTFALVFLFCHRLSSGLILLVIGGAIAWSRIYLGIHWPFDMLGALLISIAACLITQLIWDKYGDRLFQYTQSLYRYCFALPIRKGWVRN